MLNYVPAWYRLVDCRPKGDRQEHELDTAVYAIGTDVKFNVLITYGLRNGIRSGSCTMIIAEMGTGRST